MEDARCLVTGDTVPGLAADTHNNLLIFVETDSEELLCLHVATNTVRVQPQVLELQSRAAHGHPHQAAAVPDIHPLPESSQPPVAVQYLLVKYFCWLDLLRQYVTKVLDAEVPPHLLLVTHSPEAGTSLSEIADIGGAEALEYL